jgi:glyoxylase-like metal-dependent hydrolase (beta-lactamase superfamily II)
MDHPKIHTIDLKFRGISGTIASYLIPHNSGAVLIESGPGSTISALEEGLAEYGYRIEDISDVLLTHIHLDHAGASGWLAEHGARIYVHPVGAPHMINPENLLKSAGRIYGDLMKPLWGKFLAVPEENISIPREGDNITINNLEFKVIDTSGHANHHYAYLFENICFCGDIGGVRMRGRRHISLPMPPPEFHVEKWRASIEKLRVEKFKFIAPTHFNIYDDPEWQLDAIERALDEIESWMEDIMPSEPSIEKLRVMITELEHQRVIDSGLDDIHESVQYAANPPYMSADGVYRYWHKYHDRKQ